MFVKQRIRLFVFFLFSFVTLLILTRVFVNPGNVFSADKANDKDWILASSGSKQAGGIRSLHRDLAEELSRKAEAIELTDYSKPTAVANYAKNIEYVGNIGGSTKAVDVQGNYAYVSEGFVLTILDISNLTDPMVVSKTVLPFELSDIEIVGEFAYVAAGFRGLRIFNVSNPSEPVETGFFASWAVGLAVDGIYVYVADPQNGVRIIDVSNPTAPVEVGYYGEGAIDVAVAGDYAYVTISLCYDCQQGLLILNVADKAHPTRKGFLKTGNPQATAVTGNYAYVADGFYGLRIIDVTDPAVPSETSVLDTSGYALDVTVVDNYAYIADRESGLSIVDIANPASPAVRGSYDTPGSASSLDVVGDYAYIADGPDGLQIADISDPDMPVKTGAYDPPGYALAQRIEKVGNMLFIAATDGGLRIVDISNPSTPVEIGSFQTREGAREVAVAADYAYVSCSSDPYDNADALLQVINVTDPANPVGTGLFESWWGYPYSLAASGNYVYGAAGNGGFVSYDTTDPTKPMEIARIDTPGSAYDLAMVGNYAYIADKNGGLRIIDVSNPVQPKEVGFFKGDGSGPIEHAFAVDATEEFAYTANGYGLRVVDVSSPTDPVAMGMYEDPIESQKFVAVDGNFAVIADTAARRIFVIDISDPSKPTEIGFYKPPDYVQDLEIHGNFIFVALHDSGVLILQFSSPSKGTILVDKVTTPRGESQSFAFNLSGGPDVLNKDFSLTDTDDPWDSGYLKPGTYKVTETTPSGWIQEAATCDDGSDPSSIQLDEGETVTCTFTNTKSNPPKEFSVYLPGVMGKNKLPNH